MVANEGLWPSLQGRVRTQQGTGHLQAKERNLGKNRTLPTPWPWTSCLQNCEEINFGCLSQNSFCGGLLKLNTKFDADSLLYLLSHSERNTHTVLVLTHSVMLPPLTSTVKSSLFTHVHSSPLSSAARLHRCHANCSHYINNGWTFSR